MQCTFAFFAALSGAPPVPERNFDEDEILDSPQDPIEDLPPPPEDFTQDSIADADLPEHENSTNQEPNQVFFFACTNSLLAFSSFHKS